MIPSSRASSAGTFAALSVTTATTSNPPRASHMRRASHVRRASRLRRASLSALDLAHAPVGLSTMANDGRGGLRSLFRVQGFRRLFAGQAVSGLGDWVATLAFIALAFDITRSQTAVAIVLILRLVPPIFAAPVGGVLADRLDRRLVMVTCDLIRAGLIVLVPFFGIGILYVIAFAHECLSLVFLPARDASVPLLVPDREENLPLANGLVLASSFGTIPFAAAVFGLLRVIASHWPSFLPLSAVIHQHRTAFAFFFDGATFVFSASMIVRIAIPRDPAGADINLFSGVAAGFRYLL